MADTSSKHSANLPPTAVCFAVFILSGFAGLIYETTWVRYLKSILGHEAYAQALVLGIFLGGLAIGAALISKYVERLSAPLLCYAIAEAVLALAAIGFHDLFVLVREILEAGLGGSLVVHWLAAAMLILPQAVLLGVTFPLLAAALVRGRSATAGKVVSWLYASNSFGGCLGALVVGFALVEWGGLPGSMFIGGLASAMAGLVAWTLHHRCERAPPVNAVVLRQEVTRGANLSVLTLVAAGTGMASLVYEVVWVRMLALVLGSSTRSFEVMLAAFIFGLAVGGLYVRNLPDRADRLRLLAQIQLLMGALAIAGLFYYESLYPLLAHVRSALPLTTTGYTGYGISGFLLALLLMFGPTFCAGMTLPLLTRAALAHSGERALGSIYAWNTAGAIVGIALTVLVLLPVLGLKYALLVGAAIDLGLGVLLLRVAQRQRMLWGAAAAVALLGFALLAPNFSLLLLSSGPYRSGYNEQRLQSGENRILYYRDGSAISIAVLQTSKLMALKSNGRSEGSISPNKFSPKTDTDSYNSVLFASLGLLHNPAAQQVAVIGYGTGLTTSTLLSSDEIKQVTTLEIEPAVIEAGAFFPARASEAARIDPRSELLVMDAKQYFANRRDEPLDLIVSIPSHPWVSGVASLFTKEHFKAMSDALADNGVLVQWIHLYEMDTESLASVLTAVDEAFPDYVTYLNSSDIGIVASNDSLQLQSFREDTFTRLPSLAEKLKPFDIYSPNDVASHVLADRARLQPYIESFRMPSNSDYFPILDQLAPRAFYLRLGHGMVPAFRNYANYFMPEYLPGRNMRVPFAPVSPTAWRGAQSAINIALSLLDDTVPLAVAIRKVYAKNEVPLHVEEFLAQPCTLGDKSVIDELAGLLTVLRLTNYLYQQERVQLWRRMEAELPCMAKVRVAAASRQVFAYFTAFINGNHEMMLAIGNDLLPPWTPVETVSQADVLLTMMGAALQLGRNQEALELSFRINDKTSVDIRHAVRMLGAHALQAIDSSTR